MQSLTVKDLMVPKEDYAHVSAHHTLGEAALALQDAQHREQRENPDRHRDRAILVLDDDGRVIGKLSMLSVLRGLQPRYDRVTGSGALSKASARIGSARHVIESMAEHTTLWKKPLANLAEKASTISVDHLVRPFVEDELIDFDAPMDTALHQLIRGRYQSLLVTRDEEIIGILRLIDVYEGISEMLRAAGHSPAGH